MNFIMKSLLRLNRVLLNMYLVYKIKIHRQAHICAGVVL